MSGPALIRKHAALLLLAAFVLTSVSFIACGGGDDLENGEGDLEANARCIPFTVRKCRGPRGCEGTQTCLATGRGYTPCSCTGADASDDARSGDASDDGASSGDAPSSGDASDDGPSSGDASDDGPSSGDAGDDAPSSNGWGMLELLDYIRR
jgi:hypothetical protein